MNVSTNQYLNKSTFLLLFLFFASNVAMAQLPKPYAPPNTKPIVVTELIKTDQFAQKQFANKRDSTDYYHFANATRYMAANMFSSTMKTTNCASSSIAAARSTTGFSRAVTATSSTVATATGGWLSTSKQAKRSMSLSMAKADFILLF